MTENISSTETGRLEQIARGVRRECLRMTTRAGSGHPTSSLSAADLMTALFFGGVLRFDTRTPAHPNNDRVIFSKGHASPLLYALWHAAGVLSAEQLEHYRELGSALEGHPVPAFPYAEAATGSLGQGLSIGAGMAINLAWPRKDVYNATEPFHWYLQYGAILFIGIVFFGGLAYYWLVQRHKTGVLASHGGRPKGAPDPRYSLRPVAARLAAQPEVEFASPNYIAKVSPFERLELQRLRAELGPGA